MNTEKPPALIPKSARYTWRFDYKTREYVIYDGWFLCEVKRYKRHSSATKFCRNNN